MRLLSFGWLQLLLLSVSITIVAPNQHLRGVDPQFTALYNAEQFTCLDGSAVLPKSAVNDEYCDCVDGSDEPGTAACGSGRFYCVNAGYRPEWLPSYFVDDGICDCCDGSDERHGECVNHCSALGEKVKQELRRKCDEYEAALKEKKSRLGNADSVKGEWEKELQECLEEIDQQKERCDTLKQRLDVIEEEERNRKAAEQRAEQEAAMNKSQSATETESNASNSIDRSNPIQSDETEDPSAESEEIRLQVDIENDVADEKEAEGEVVAESNEDNPKELETGFSDDEEDNDEADDIDYDRGNDDEDDRGNDDGEDDGVDDEEEDDQRTREERDGSSSPSLFNRVKRWSTSLFKSSEDSKTRQKKPRRPHRDETELQSLRRAHSKETKELNDMEQRRDKLKSRIHQDYGPESQFISLVDTCFELKQDKYSYEICPFDKASQKERHHKINLGKFDGFGADYLWMQFDKGQRCSHGKDRSLKVFFTCGKQDGIQSVTEPDICEYAANFSTPIACSQTELDNLKQQVDLLGTELPMKDEL